MRIHVYNYATSFGVTLRSENNDYDAPYYFSTIDDAIAYAEEEIDVRLQAIGASIYDANTGELYMECYKEDPEDEQSDYEDWEDQYADYDYEPDIEMGFNPYLGAYDFDC